MSPATRLYVHDQPFSFSGGGALPGLTLAWESWGELDADASNAVLILTGLSPDAHAASSPDDPDPGWWEFMIGPGKPIDTDRYFVLCVNSLGSCKGSTGPASPDPASGRPWRLSFPKLSVRDIAGAARLVVRDLGIEQLCAVVGASMGGMTALAWLQQDPAGARHMVNISSAPRSEPFSIAIRSLQREMIVTDPLFADGEYDDDHWPENGMRLARKLGMMSYRSAVEWQDRFGRDRQYRYPRERFGMTFEVESYLEAAAQRFTGGFDPCSYLYLSQAMDEFDASAGFETLREALDGVMLSSALVMGVETDLLFPNRQQREIANALAALDIDSRLELLDSPQGHDAFLVDTDGFGRLVGAYFREISRREGLGA